MTAWLDGELVPLADAKISVLDHGLVVGDGVFETLRVYDGVPFAWTRHLARLRASAVGLGLALPDPAQLRAAADAVLAANELREARLRITVTGGPAPPGSGRGDAPPTAFILAFPFEPSPPAADVVIAPWTRNEHGATAGLKTISYAANVRALADARARGASEAIFANTQGNLCEATGSNVFCVVDGVLRTPPPTAGCLLGVTRGVAHRGVRTARDPDGGNRRRDRRADASRRSVPVVDNTRGAGDRARRRHRTARRAGTHHGAARVGVSRPRRLHARPLTRANDFDCLATINRRLPRGRCPDRRGIRGPPAWI